MSFLGRPQVLGRELNIMMMPARPFFKAYAAQSMYLVGALT